MPFGAMLSVVLFGASLLRREALEAPALRVTGQIGGPTIAAAVAGNIALAGAGYRLILYDISDPAKPREVGALALEDVIRAIAIADTRAYVAAGGSGLHIIDVADPSKPSLIASWNSPGSCEGIALKGSNAYVADGPFGLQVVDISVPQQPTPVGSAFDDFFAFDVAISGNVALIAAADAGLLIADVSDPRSPKEIASLDTPGFARGVGVTGSRVVIADQWEGLRIVDVSDPRSPRETGALAMRSWAMDVAVEQSIAFVATGSAGFVAVDIADAARPREVSSIPITSGDAVSVAASGGRAVLATSRTGLQIIETTNPASPRVLGAVTPLPAAVGVAIGSSHAYVTGSPWLTVVDISSPARPREIATFGTNQIATSHFVLYRQGIVYIETAGSTFVALDVADPSRPVETARLQYPSGANIYGAVVRDNLLITAAENHFVIVDLSDPRKPVIRSTLPMRAAGLAVSDHFALVGEEDAGLTIIDIADPASPRVVARYQPPGMSSVGPLAGTGHYLFASSCGTIEVLDVTNPMAPRAAGSIPFKGCAGKATIAGDRLYVLSATDGIVEIDISNPLAPAILSSTPLVGTLLNMTVDGTLVAAAARLAGLFLLDRSATAATLSFADIRSPEGSKREEQHPAPKAHTIITVATSHREPSPAGRQIVVSSTANTGTGTLQRALASAVDGDVITFDPAIFPSQSPAVIRLATELECVPRGVTIDGRNAGVVIDGSEITSFANGIRICSDRSVVMGLQVINFTGSGIDIAGGTDSVIAGNLLSGNAWAGIDTSTDTARNRIVGNRIGIVPQGRVLKQPQPHGIFLQSSDNIIGGTSDNERNLISGNTIVGVSLGPGHNTVSGNYIGTDATGTSVMPTQTGTSSQTGISISSSHDNLISDNIIAAGTGISISDPGSSYNRIIRNRVGIGPNGERISGTLTRIRSAVGGDQPYNLIADNIVGGFPSSAIAVSTGEMYVIRNRIGVDVPNSAPGISVRGAQRAFIGARSETEANVIRGKNGPAIEITGPTATQNFVVGNIIGPSDTAGIAISSSRQNFIQRNTITANPVGIKSSDGSRNRIRRNSIFANNSAGIADDSAAPPPLIAEVGSDYVKGSACTGCIVEIFSDAGNEGGWFEGDAVAASDGRFTMHKSAGILRGPRVSATATDLSGTTSVFSATAQTPPPPPRRRAVRK